MIKTLKTLIALSTIAYSGGATALAEDMNKTAYQVGSLSISDVYTSRTHKSAQTAAVFMGVIHNGSEERRITKASSPAAERVELHNMFMDGDVMQMREAEDGYVLTANTETDLNEQGAHFMLIGLKAPLVTGEMISLTIELDNGTKQTIEVPVLDMSDVQTKQGGMH